MDIVGWVKDYWALIYFGGGAILGGLTALAMFAGIWWGAAYKYALGGLVAGWIPGAVAATVSFFVMMFGWPLIVPLVMLFGTDILRALEEAGV